MLKVELIGHLGADAEVKDYEGKKFATMRVADSSSYKDSKGVVVEKTRWIDLALTNYEKVLPYLKKGVQVFVRGNLDTRVYSSEKDKCMKCGLSIRVSEIQLLSAGKSNDNTDKKESHGEDYKGF